MSLIVTFILTMPLFLARFTLITIKSLSICFRVICISITTILKRRGCLTVPRLTLMSLIKMMLVMVSVAAISKTFGLLRFLLRLSSPNRSEERFSRNAETELYTLSLHDALPISNPNELNQDDARYGFRCCHLKNIWTAPLPPETEQSK